MLVRQILAALQGHTFSKVNENHFAQKPKDNRDDKRSPLVEICNRRRQ